MSQSELEEEDLDEHCLDHAPATSHGTHLETFLEDVEDLEDYEIGGYHPVHLSDFLDDGHRYRVVHKLGHGGFSTVWLCRDTQQNQYVAVKIHAGDVPLNKIADIRLIDLDKSISGVEFINIPRDHFSLEGPNGTHHCIVLDLLGPRVSPQLWERLENPGPILRNMCQQTVHAMKFLHDNNLCHGDFRPANILVKLANLDHLNEDEPISLVSDPQQSGVLTESGEDPPSSTPRYLVGGIDFSKLSVDFLTDQICVVDFGESFSMTSPPKELGIPEHYLPPEVLIEGGTAIGPTCDLWALGCTSFEIRLQVALFYMMNGRDDLLAEMVDFFGRFPRPWWRDWEARADFFDEDGHRVYIDESGSMIKAVCEEGQKNTLRFHLNRKKQIQERNSDRKFIVKKTMVVSEKEQALCEDLLLKLFSYAPASRLSAAEALKHDWFKMSTEE